MYSSIRSSLGRSDILAPGGSPEKFGHCQQCGQEINFERLDALPHARLCITCKEKEEDGKRR